MTVFDFLSSYWWLIFVLIWPVMGIFHSLTHYNHRSEMLKMLKSYADQGKEPPAALLDAMKSDEQRAYDGDYYGRRRWRRYRGGGWGGMVAFAAMAAGFGYAGYYGHMGEASTVFTALAVAFGIAAVAMFVKALIDTLSGPRLDPRDYDDRK